MVAAGLLQRGAKLTENRAEGGVGILWRLFRPQHVDELSAVDRTAPIRGQEDKGQANLSPRQITFGDDVVVVLDQDLSGQVDAGCRQGFAKLPTRFCQVRPSILPGQKEESCRK